MAALESKNAGKALAVIVMLLVLPMLLIGYFYHSISSVEIRALENEIAGSKLLQTVYPVMMSSGKEAKPEQLAAIQELERKHGISDNESFAYHWAVEKNQHAKLSTASHNESLELDVANYVTGVAANSGLSLDNDLSTYYLIDATVLTLPRQVKDLWSLGEMMQSLATNPSNFKSKLPDIAQLQGRVLAIRDRFEDSLIRSVKYGGDSENIEKIRAEDAQMGAKIEELSTLIATSNQGLSSQTYFKFARSSNSIATIKSHAWVISAAAFAELDHKLFVRLTAAKNRLNALTLLGFVTAALGLCLAHQMFRKTLIKLDQVETGRAVALTAQADAERINDEIANLNRDLADKVKALQEAQNEIVKKGRMEQLGQLTATIAHELRNPLGSVRTSAYLINRKAGGKGLGIDDQISRIEKGVVRCDNIITQLLDFSRTKQISAMPANLDSWLTGIITEEANKLPAQVHVDCILGLDDALVPFDPARMQRAVINLMNNAVEAMINKDIKAGDPVNGYPHIWISTLRIGDDAVIRVKDNGPGIDAELISKIREPLYTTKSFGTGLGIPAIEQIAVQHNGRLEIHSRKGEGAEFSIFIPMTETKHETPPDNLAAVA